MGKNFCAIFFYSFFFFPFGFIFSPGPSRRPPPNRATPRIAGVWGGGSLPDVWGPGDPLQKIAQAKRVLGGGTTPSKPRKKDFRRVRGPPAKKAGEKTARGPRADPPTHFPLAQAAREQERAMGFSPSPAGRGAGVGAHPASSPARERGWVSRRRPSGRLPFGRAPCAAPGGAPHTSSAPPPPGPTSGAPPRRLHRLGEPGEQGGASATAPHPPRSGGRVPPVNSPKNSGDEKPPPGGTKRKLTFRSTPFQNQKSS